MDKFRVKTANQWRKKGSNGFFEIGIQAVDLFLLVLFVESCIDAKCDTDIVVPNEYGHEQDDVGML